MGYLKQYISLAEAQLKDDDGEDDQMEEDLSENSKWANEGSRTMSNGQMSANLEDLFSESSDDESSNDSDDESGDDDSDAPPEDDSNQPETIPLAARYQFYVADGSPIYTLFKLKDMYMSKGDFCLEEIRPIPGAFHDVKQLVTMKTKLLELFQRDYVKLYDSELFFLAVRLSLPLCAMNNSYHYIQICFKILLWRAKASDEEVYLFEELAFTRFAEHGEYQAADCCQEKVSKKF